MERCSKVVYKIQVVRFVKKLAVGAEVWDGYFVWRASTCVGLVQNVGRNGNGGVAVLARTAFALVQGILNRENDEGVGRDGIVAPRKARMLARPVDAADHFVESAQREGESADDLFKLCYLLARLGAGRQMRLVR